MANLKKGDTFFAPKDILAFKMDDVTVTLSFQKGQKIGVVENIESGYISFLSSFDDGWGNSGDAEFYVYSSDFNVKEDTDGTGTTKTDSKTTVDDVNDILKKTTDRKETTQKDNAKDTQEPEAKTILGLSTGTFIGVVAGLLLLILLVVLFWKSDEPKVVYQQTQPQTLSGVDKADINVMPKINFVES